MFKEYIPIYFRHEEILTIFDVRTLPIVCLCLEANILEGGGGLEPGRGAGADRLVAHLRQLNAQAIREQAGTDII